MKWLVSLIFFVAAGIALVIVAKFLAVFLAAGFGIWLLWVAASYKPKL
ncbi:hypothetical protein JXA40_11650 [bacterium]|nr:hypothetical protein [candidate division CSSED10-310 bacterium]